MNDNIIEYKVKITKQAKYYIKKICDYITIDLESPETAKRLLSTFKEEIKSLAFMPARIKLTDEEPWRSKGIHRMKVKNYYIYFWINEIKKKVYITSVVFTRRNQVNHLKNTKLTNL